MLLAWDRAKDPDEIVDYDLTWAAQMAADSDTISTSTWTVPAGITKLSSVNTTTVAKIWLSGGTDGQTYSLLNRIVTAGGRTFDQTVRIRVRSR